MHGQRNTGEVLGEKSALQSILLLSLLLISCSYLLMSKLGDCAIALRECHFHFCCATTCRSAKIADSPGCVATKKEVILTICKGTLNTLV